MFNIKPISIDLYIPEYVYIKRKRKEKKEEKKKKKKSVCVYFNIFFFPVNKEQIHLIGIAHQDAVSYITSRYMRH